MNDLQRVIIVGGSCAGKTTLAKQLAEKLGVPRIELDALYWGPNWKENPPEQFRESVEQAVAQPCWVCDGNYTFAHDVIWPQATTIIWLDYSFPLVFQRALRRTVSRVFRRTSLYGGNRETFFQSFLSRESILLWVLQSHHNRHKQIDRLLK
ncbi:MAG: adenylate kinase [Planctomycetes bacterium]|nr:adenylate kinase [Planctomycetota bacterium]